MKKYILLNLLFFVLFLFSCPGGEDLDITVKPIQPYSTMTIDASDLTLADLREKMVEQSQLSGRKLFFNSFAVPLDIDTLPSQNTDKRKISIYEAMYVLTKKLNMRWNREEVEYMPNLLTERWELQPLKPGEKISAAFFPQAFVWLEKRQEDVDIYVWHDPLDWVCLDTESRLTIQISRNSETITAEGKLTHLGRYLEKVTFVLPGMVDQSSSWKVTFALPAFQISDASAVYWPLDIGGVKQLCPGIEIAALPVQIEHPGIPHKKLAFQHDIFSFAQKKQTPVLLEVRPDGSEQYPLPLPKYEQKKSSGYNVYFLDLSLPLNGDFSMEGVNLFWGKLKPTEKSFHLKINF